MGTLWFVCWNWILIEFSVTGAERTWLLIIFVAQWRLHQSQSLGFSSFPITACSLRPHSNLIRLHNQSPIFHPHWPTFNERYTSVIERQQNIVIKFTKWHNYWSAGVLSESGHDRNKLSAWFEYHWLGFLLLHPFARSTLYGNGL